MNLSEKIVSSTMISGSRNFRVIVAADIIAGFASHILYFIRGEHHMNAPVLFYLYTALAVAAFFLELQTDAQTYRGAGQSTALHVCTYTVTLFTSITIYRVCFHRLHSFPGPFLARVSKFWHVYQARHSMNHQLILRLHKEYGPFVRTGTRNTHTYSY